MESKKVVSIIMGGGRGSRLFPLTEERAKPAVPIGGKYRLIDVSISNCLNSDFTRIFVLTQFNSASLNRHIKNTYNFSLFSQGFVDILAAEQTYAGNNWFEGTADAVRRTLNHLDRVDYEYVLILSGDHLYHMDYSKMVKFHEDRGGDITIGTIPVTAEDAPGFGILKSDDKNNVVSFVEKPTPAELPNWVSDVPEELKAQGKNYLASMGIYVFSKKVLAKLLKENSGTDFGKEIIPDSIQDYKVLSYPFDSFWADIGTVKSFFDVTIGLTKPNPDFSMFNTRVYTRGRMLPPSKVFKTILEEVILSDACIINAERIEQSVIGIRSRVGEGTIIKRAYLMGAESDKTLNEGLCNKEYAKVPIIGIGKNCYIENAIIDRDCRIGDNVQIIGGEELEDQDVGNYAVKDGIVIIRKNAVLPSGTKIGAERKD